MQNLQNSTFLRHTATKYFCFNSVLILLFHLGTLGVFSGMGLILLELGGGGGGVGATC